VTSGLILLALLGVLAGFGLSRLRGRMGLRVSWGMWVATVAAVMLLGLALWAYSVRR
jgi:hypothetical protein